MNDKIPIQIPHQVEKLISDMLNKNDNVHLRGNFRLRLDAIRGVIDKAIRDYDNEVILAEGFRNKKKGNR